MKANHLSALAEFIGRFPLAWATFATQFPEAQLISFEFRVPRGAFLAIDAQGIEYGFRLYGDAIIALTTPEKTFAFVGSAIVLL